eukprot:262597-Hanusia_phi.AAC.1
MVTGAAPGGPSGTPGSGRPPGPGPAVMRRRAQWPSLPGMSSFEAAVQPGGTQAAAAAALSPAGPGRPGRRVTVPVGPRPPPGGPQVGPGCSVLWAPGCSA